MGATSIKSKGFMDNMELRYPKEELAAAKKVKANDLSEVRDSSQMKMMRIQINRYISKTCSKKLIRDASLNQATQEVQR